MKKCDKVQRMCHTVLVPLLSPLLTPPAHPEVSIALLPAFIDTTHVTHRDLPHSDAKR